MRQSNSPLRFEAESKAELFRKDNGIGETDSINLYSLLFKKGIVTLFRPLDGDFSGMALKLSSDAMFMLVNSSHSLGKQHFTIAHELYHLLVQEGFASQKCKTGRFDSQDDDEEKRADLFAATLLLPKSGVSELIPKTELNRKNQISTETIFRILEYYGVSFTAVLYRLIEFELIDKSYYDKYRTGRISLGRKYGYDGRLFKPGNTDKTIGDYASLASKLYKEQSISEGYYLELLNAIGFDPYANGATEDAD